MTTQTAAEPEEQSMPVSVIPIQKKKSKTKTVHSVRDEEEAGLSEQEEEASSRVQASLLLPGGMCSIPGTNCPRGPTICHGLIQIVLQKGKAPEHLPYIDGIIIGGNTAKEVFEKGEKIIQIFLKASFAIKQRTNRKWKAAVWSSRQRVTEAIEGQGGSSQIEDLKAIQLALNVTEREKWQVFYLCSDSWMVANALWEWLDQWKKANWQLRGKPIWAAELWQDIAAPVGLLKVEVQQVPVATSTVHRRQYRTNRDAVIPIHKMIRELESQGVVTKTHSPFNSPIWPVRKSDREWRLTVDYRALNEVTPLLSAAVPDMLELQYELESKAARCPTICHGLIQAALEKGEALEHLQYIDDIIVWGKTAAEVFEKEKKIIQILLEAGFAIKKSKVKGPAREIQFLGVK
ncbi:hypothetical protein HGM15179_018354 [Zosterops borbonicus]|uniref:RNase H type-1 domain-containing protein n=1 Tax=Zosterops borbonicus TaxID=364589 RepID=A0A8K1FZ79_9PASS|nr:hypothetical protein HGM15179_018354 [Zosterops borbonicus]